jgi:hypothetical protein
MYRLQRRRVAHTWGCADERAPYAQEFRGFNAELNRIGDGLRRTALIVGLLGVRVGAAISDTRVERKRGRLAPFRIQNCARN